MRKFFGGVFIGLIFLSIGQTAFAQPNVVGSPPPQVNVVGSPTAKLENPLNFSSLCGFLKATFNAIVTIGIPIAVLFIVWAGFLFVWARGNPEALKRARDNALWVAIGIAVFLGAWFLSQIIAVTIERLGGPTISSCR